MIAQPPDFFMSDEIECRQLGFDAVTIMNPERGDEIAEAAAKTVCDQCIYIEECRDWGMNNKQVGVLGGLTEHERVLLKNKINRERRRGNGL